MDLCSRLLYTIYTLTGPVELLAQQISTKGENMDKDCARTHKKLDKIQDDIHEIKLDVQKNTLDIMYHIKRTNLLESRMKMFYLKEISILLTLVALAAKLLGLY